MTETHTPSWPGVRQTNDGKFSFSINVGNRTYIEGEYFDAESAARGHDQTKYALLQAGHLQRANFYHFPAEVSQWQNGEKNTPQPCSALLAFMSTNPARYIPFSQRQVEEEQKKVVKETRALAAVIPASSKLLAAYKCLKSLNAATLNAEELAAVALLLPKLMQLIQ